MSLYVRDPEVDKLAARLAAVRGETRSCPIPWCSFDGLALVISGEAGIGQLPEMGRLTMGLSLRLATDSRLM